MDVVERIEERLTPEMSELFRRPREVALLSDVDGTLAPIVARPEDAAVPDSTRQALVRAAGHFGFLGFVSGRPALEARDLVGIAEATYVGVHGLERLDPGDTVVALAQGAEEGEAAIDALLAEIDAGALASAGVRVENKGAVLALHWRGATDEHGAAALAQEIAGRAVEQGLEARPGRMVLELRPQLPIDKGTAIAELLAEHGLRRCIYAGDDNTDVDAFHQLARLQAAGELDVCLRIGIRSPEGPEAIITESDLQLENPGEMAGFLTWAATRAGGSQ